MRDEAQRRPEYDAHSQIPYTALLGVIERFARTAMPSCSRDAVRRAKDLHGRTVLYETGTRAWSYRHPPSGPANIALDLTEEWSIATHSGMIAGSCKAEERLTLRINYNGDEYTSCLKRNRITEQPFGMMPYVRQAELGRWSEVPAAVLEEIVARLQPDPKPSKGIYVQAA